MAKEDLLQFPGIVEEVLPNTQDGEGKNGVSSFNLQSVERTDQRFGHRFMGLVKYSFMCTILMIPTWHFRGDGSGNGCGALQ